MPSELARRIAEALDDDRHDDFMVLYSPRKQAQAREAMAATIDAELEKATPRTLSRHHGDGPDPANVPLSKEPHICATCRALNTGVGCLDCKDGSGWRTRP
jgi:hypothetical protein